MGILALVLLAFFAVSILSLRFGSLSFTSGEIISALFSEADSLARNIVMNIRLPRLLLAGMVGANLAISGALLQSVMRNPLADPGLTGVSTGAALVAVTIMLVFPSLSGLVPVAAFVGGTLAVFLVYLLAWKRGIDPIRIILAGVAVNALLGGGTSLLSILYSDRIQGVLMWLNGSIAGRSWYHVRMLAPYSILGLLAAVLCIKAANLLQLGDDVAKNLGLKVNVARVVLSFVAAFLAGISVSVVGLIGFVGLIIPHVSRLLIGSDYKFMLPLSALLGSILLIIADTAARTVFRPVELPVGIIMAVVGGPFFLYLLRKGGAMR
ncbi:MAG: iron ABC transporter permease [Firmicutes bacterium]|nr:iron ABC transporter permease [Dethiobacter sp.]MBS3888347.1 iron ABC transporter permease [Bacillota bacterium]MBS4054511.1 iron ABC transporter permease [Thermaerobacter sp.]